MTQEKEIEKFKKIVTKKYPKAKAVQVSKNKYTIVESNGLGLNDLLSSLLLPYQPTELDAWKVCTIGVRTMQNINRTHPLKADLETIEAKLLKAEQTSIKVKKRVSKKPKLTDNY